MARKSKTPSEQRPDESTTIAPPDPPILEAAVNEPVGAETVLDTAAVAIPSSATRRRGLVTLAGAMIAIVVVGGGIAASWPLWAPHLANLLPVARQDPFADPRLIGIADRLSVLEHRQEIPPNMPVPAADIRIDDLVAGLQRLAGEVRAVAAEVDGLRLAPMSPRTDGVMAEDGAVSLLLAARLEKFEQTLQTLSSRLDEGSARTATDELAARQRELAEAFAALTLRIERLAIATATERPAAAPAARLEFAVALAGLRQALASPAPFRQELAAVEAALHEAGGDVRALTALMPHASRGVPTVAVLRRRFDAVAKEIVGADRAPPGSGWMASTIERLKGLITVRRIDGPDGIPDADVAVSRAESALSNDDLTAAVSALERLHGTPAEAAFGWLEDARTRLAAERALAQLDTRLAAGGKGG